MEVSLVGEKHVWKNVRTIKFEGPVIKTLLFKDAVLILYPDKFVICDFEDLENSFECEYVFVDVTAIHNGDRVVFLLCHNGRIFYTNIKRMLTPTLMSMESVDCFSDVNATSIFVSLTHESIVIGHDEKCSKISLSNILRGDNITFGDMQEVEIAGSLENRLQDWREDPKTGLVTVGSGELFHLQRVGVNGHRLTKAKLGMNSSSDERKGIPSSQAILKSNGDHVMVTLSQNGAVFPLRLEEIDFGCFSLTSKKLLGYVCLLCLSKHQNCNHLRDHFSSQHVGPVLCDRCGRQQADWVELRA